MKSIIIFRFHNNLHVCLNRLKLLRFFNPHTPIYGIYGADEPFPEKYKKLFSEYFSHQYTIPTELRGMRWSNFESVLKDWFLKIGKELDFDRAYVIEWDLLLLDSLQNIYSHIGADAVGMTGLIPLHKIANNWYWICEEPGKTNWQKLLAFIRFYYNYSSTPYAGLGPGLCFPKSYLAAYAKLKMPMLCHEEIYFPLFAQLLNYPLQDTRFFNGWFDVPAKKYFNCDRKPIANEIILKEYHDHNRKVFHPCVTVFP